MSLPLRIFSSANFAFNLVVIQPSVTAAPVADATSLLFSASLSAPALVASIAALASFFVSSTALSVQAGAEETTPANASAIRHFEKLIQAPSPLDSFSGAGDRIVGVAAHSTDGGLNLADSLVNFTLGLQIVITGQRADRLLHLALRLVDHPLALALPHMNLLSL